MTRADSSLRRYVVRPFSVVLFDEIEKAHPDIFNSLLQVLEDGRLTDSQGRAVDFKNTVIIMTTNLGTRDISKTLGLGFHNSSDALGNYERMKAKVADELKNHFRPEFLNRIDDVVVFHQFSEAEIIQIVDLMISNLDERLRAKDMANRTYFDREEPVRRTWLRSIARCTSTSSHDST
jgi:ATP-dependent Clp protease ATP-binding subunit ClpC